MSDVLLLCFDNSCFSVLFDMKVTVNLRISTWGAYFKFRRGRGNYSRGGGGGRLFEGGRVFNFSQIVA